jgi:hypothetical protein
MGIDFRWARTDADDNEAPGVQVFYESFPLQTMPPGPDAEIRIDNVVPGRAYRIQVRPVSFVRRARVRLRV